MRLATLQIAQDEDIVRIRQVAQETCEALGLRTFARTRIVTAILELARNTLQHGGGGRMMLELEGDEGRVALVVEAVDQGPGIRDLDRILAGGATPLPHQASSGLGLGLRGVHRMADAFEVETSANGTRITARFASELPEEALAKTARSVSDAMMSLDKTDPGAVLAQQNRELMEALAERDLMMAEVHHRTGNNLALVSGLIRLSRNSAKSDETREALADLEGRINAITKVHEQLQQRNGSDTLQILPLLRDVADRATTAFTAPGQRVQARVIGEDVELTGSAAVDVALVVGELIVNSLKHAFAEQRSGRIDISVALDARGLVLNVADDGPGLPEGMEKPERATSLGWRMIRSTAQKHGGSISVKGKDGMTVELILDPATVIAADSSA
jgi:two-component sensor histidine kinase